MYFLTFSLYMKFKTAAWERGWLVLISNGGRQRPEMNQVETNRGIELEYEETEFPTVSDSQSDTLKT